MAVVRGGDYRAIRSGSVRLDGSASYDEGSMPGAMGYQWTCMRGGLRHGEACGATLDASAVSQTVTGLAAGRAPYASAPCSSSS